MFSIKLDKLREAKSIVINQEVYEKKRKGEKVITLSLGEAFFNIPDFGFDTIDFDRGYHYSDSIGWPELRKNLLNYIQTVDKVSDINLDNIIISAGSKVLTYASMLSVLNSGDEVLLHEPAWLSYEDQATLCSANTTYIPYSIPMNKFNDYFSEKTKLIVINNPNNPAGWIYDEEDLRNLIKVASERGIFVLVDEAYSNFVRANHGFVSACNWVNEFDNLIVVNSMSKNFGMSGWRVGYLVANKTFVQQMVKLNQHIITCAPTPLQMYLAKYLKEIHKVCSKEIELLLDKRDKVAELFEKNGLETLPGASTFYFFVNISGSGKSSEDFSFDLLKNYNIAVVPGSAYGRTTDEFIRLSFGTESLSDIEYAIKVISRNCKGL
ncbi:TPA: pyridoxal phosphate-dependent aminotransferase [Vibrio harveyi]|nr:pyridoxal phosphate-dependent aminotransferase [Vibrio harveyi]